MKNLISLLILSIISLGAIAQTQVNVSVDETNGKIHLKLEKEVDGKKTVIDKTYNSIEEMKNDPELEGMDLHIFDGDGHKFVFKKGDDGEEIDINVVVEVDDEDLDELHKGMQHAIFLKSEGDTVKTEEIKIVIDEDGKKHIYRNGKEVDPEEWEEIESKKFDFQSKDGKKIIIKQKKGGNDDEEVEIDMNVIVEIAEDADIDLSEEIKKVIIMDSDSDKEEIKIWIDDDGKKHIIRNGKEIDPEELEEIHDHTFDFNTEDAEIIILKDGKKKVIKSDDGLEVYEFKSKGDSKEKKTVKIKVADKGKLHLVSEHGFNSVPMYDAEPLELSEILYYPDLKTSKLQLQFKANSNPTEIKLVSQNGDVAYSESVDKFKGKYSKEINISNLSEGVYLLQIIQGDKAFNKKIVIE